ncbi:MAG: PRC-barrel domain-containing protein [Patescibacteria group bacterium]
MRITLKQIKSLPVETASGTALGHVHDLVIDIDTHFIVQYEVHSSLLSGHRSYLINREQVLSVTKEKIVVADTAATENAKPASGKAGIQPEPIAMRKSH